MKTRRGRWHRCALAGRLRSRTRGGERAEKRPTRHDALTFGGMTFGTHAVILRPRAAPVRNGLQYTAPLLVPLWRSCGPRGVRGPRLDEGSTDLGVPALVTTSRPSYDDLVTKTLTKRLLVVGALTLPPLFTSACINVSAQPARSGVVVRLAELVIDPAQLETYKAFLREEIETSIRVEPGVLTLYAVAVKGQPTHIRLFETYASQAAYEAHVQSAHFRKYKTGTQSMVKSLTLLETEPVLLGTRLK
jgi:quinol monooxygenase YgiN